jgi:hypothetical protein
LTLRTGWAAVRRTVRPVLVVEVDGDGLVGDVSGSAGVVALPGGGLVASSPA